MDTMMRAILRILVCVCACLLFVSCGSDNNNGGGNPPPAAQPTITSMTPRNVSRGQLHVDGSILGTNLGSVVSVTLGEGITVENFAVANATEITVQFSVSVNASAGARTITVNTSTGSTSSSAMLTVDSNQAPTAKVVITPEDGAKNTTFTCDGTKSSDPDGTITAYKWNFGDGQSANGRVATHKFGKAGTFDITLTVKDGKNASASAGKSVNVANGLAPIARYTANPESGDIDTQFTFNASASEDKDGTIKSYKWKFGDGGTGDGVSVTHKFHTDGVFTVELTVTDNDGLENVLGRDVRVEKFDSRKAIDEMTFVVDRFFSRYAKLDRLDAETIVEGWSVSPECQGRDHEIAIIEQQQQLLEKTSVEIKGNPDVFIHSDHVNANYNITAVFDWVEKNGTVGHAEVTHDFSFKFEDGEWHICNFHIQKDSDANGFFPRE